MPDFDKQERRIAEIFGESKIPEVGKVRLETFRKYLEKNLDRPCWLTGSEDFEWEEYYVLGPGSKKEYERLKKRRPSYQDTFELLGLDAEIDEEQGIFANVRRITDRKKFLLPLADLRATDKRSKNYKLVEDYAVWFVNYG
jgi:hypothetical protein